jgi:uncharacterized protein with NRDE domain
MRNRRWDAPGRHWDDRPHVTAGRDQLVGGTWLGMNDDRLVAGILNRQNSLGPAAGKRSRGELPLDALDHAEAHVAAAAMAALDPTAYRTFNMLIGDTQGVYWIANEEASESIRLQPIPSGVSMVTVHEVNDPGSDRIRHHLPRFRAAPAPDPETGDWFAWETLLADRSRADDADWSGAMAVDPKDFTSKEGTERMNFGTVCSSLIALPAPGSAKLPIWRFAPGMPGETPYHEVMF